MATPRHLNPEAVELLERSGWHWSEYHFSFRRVRGENESTDDYLRRPPDLITYEELSDHGLSSPIGKNATAAFGGLEWLKSRLRSNGAEQHDR